MYDFIRPILEISIIIPGIVLAYLPAIAYTKQSLFKLLLQIIPLQLLISITGGHLCYALKISTGMILLLSAMISIIFYMKSLTLSYWKSGSVALAICAVFACMNSFSKAFDVMVVADNRLWFTPRTGMIYNLLCWLFLLFAWYPATHAARTLVEDENMAETWYIFWILPIIFIGLNRFMIPGYEAASHQEPTLQGYLMLSILLLVILILFYAMFLLIANSLNRNARLQQENHFLSMQQARYDNLRTTIAETCQARHDMRHHFLHLSALAQEKNWEKLEEYLEQAIGKIPTHNLHFSENRAVDSVINHYYELASKDTIPFLAKIDLPQLLPVDEMDVCLILSNLLENALEASIKCNPKQRYIKTELHLHGNHLLLILVENLYHGEIKKNGDIFLSSKRRGYGVGIQSVRRIAEKCGGISDFSYDTEKFVAKVLLHSN